MKQCALALVGAIPGCFFAGVRVRCTETRLSQILPNFKLTRNNPGHGTNVFDMGWGGHVSGNQEHYPDTGMIFIALAKPLYQGAGDCQRLE
eukprot:3859801-Rhodomonas_salina.1